jgi:hypothetical protein
MSLDEKGKEKKDNFRKGNPDYYEAPGGKKDVFIKRGKDFKTSDKYDTPDKVAGAIAGWIGRKHGKGAKMDAAGKKALARARKSRKKKAKESAIELSNDMIEQVMRGSDPFEVLTGMLDEQGADAGDNPNTEPNNKKNNKKNMQNKPTEQDNNMGNNSNNNRRNNRRNNRNNRNNSNDNWED